MFLKHAQQLRGAARRALLSSKPLSQAPLKHFSNSEVVAFENQLDKIQEDVKEERLKRNHHVYSTDLEESRELIQEREEKIRSEQDWHDTLTNPQAKEQFFARLTQEDPSDHSHIKLIKKKIDKLVKQELDLLGFREQLSQEEMDELAKSTLKEVRTRSNFYFSIDEGKKEKNLKVYNVKAPGNKHRHPSVMLPHEHVHVQHFLNTDGLDKEKLTEIYAYYTYLVDLHISQIRPHNLEDLSYIPAKFNQMEKTNQQYTELNNMFFEYYHRWREPTRTWLSQTQEINFRETLKNRPTTHHYDHDKGTKYDVEWTEDQKFPHVADRLGYPILQEAPIERILGFERAPAHPGYQFQPFVQTPSMDPDPTLNFELGETIYENTRVTEWARFWKVLSAGILCTWPAFYTFEVYAGDGPPSNSWLADVGNFWQIPKQFNDGGGLNLESYRYCDDKDYMNMHYAAKRMVVRPAHTFYMVSVLAFLQHLNLDYVTKMVYNKEKDLVFVYRPDGLWSETEYVYEMHHLEHMVPAAVTSFKDLTMQRNDGILTVHCMSTKDYLKFYNEDKYWNMDVKEDFVKQTSNLWRGNSSNKFDGQIFTQNHAADEEQALSMLKVQKELQEAVEKHGEVEIPALHEDKFYEKINKKKQQLSM